VAIANGYATLLEIKAEVGIPASDTADDARLELAVEAASRLIDSYTDRKFWVDSSAVARYYTTSSTTEVQIDGISTVTGLLVKTDDDDNGTFETSWTITTDFVVDPLNAGTDGRPWTRLVAVGDKRFPTTYRGIEVTAKGGFTAVPAPVKKACLLQASRLFKRADAPFGVAGSAELGSELRLLSSVDPDVQVLLRGYRRIWGAV
jgi:hypothetical protein